MLSRKSTFKVLFLIDDALRVLPIRISEWGIILRLEYFIVVAIVKDIERLIISAVF